MFLTGRQLLVTCGCKLLVFHSDALSCESWLFMTDSCTIPWRSIFGQLELLSLELHGASCLSHEGFTQPITACFRGKVQNPPLSPGRTTPWCRFKHQSSLWDQAEARAETTSFMAYSLLPCFTLESTSSINPLYKNLHFRICFWRNQPLEKDMPLTK